MREELHSKSAMSIEDKCSVRLQVSSCISRMVANALLQHDLKTAEQQTGKLKVMFVQAVDAAVVRESVLSTGGELQ